MPRQRSLRTSSDADAAIYSTHGPRITGLSHAPAPSFARAGQRRSAPSCSTWNDGTRWSVAAHAGWSQA